MSAVTTSADVAVLLSQKTATGGTIYLYPIVRDTEILLSDESLGVDNLEELLKKGIKPNFATIQAMFINSDDIVFSYNEENGTVQATHKNIISAGTVKGTEGTVSYNSEIEIPTFNVDKHGHITSTGTSKITLPAEYVLPKATKTSLGGVIAGTYINIDNATGTISVQEASTTQKGVVSLSHATDSTSTTEAATPKAVKDALDLALEAIDDAVTELETNGVKPDFASLSTYFLSSDDINVNIDGNKISMTHKNNVTEGSTKANENKTLTFGADFYIPEVTYDSHGHITEVTFKTLKLPANPDTNTEYELEVTDGTEQTTTGNSYNTVAKTSTIKLTDSNGTPVSGNITTKYLVYKDFTGAYAGLVPVAGSANAGKYLRGDGVWETPANDNTTYTADAGIKLDGTVFKHINSITGGSFNPGNTSVLDFGDVIKVPMFTYDNQGHLTSTTTVEFTLPNNPNITYSLSKEGNNIILTDSLGNKTSVVDSDTNTTYTLASFGITVTADEINMLAGVTKNVQEQLDEKAPSGHTHNYAGSSTAGGAATNAISDGKNQNIASTYVKSITVSGTTLTITYGDGTTKTINTQDTNTTYNPMVGASSSANGSQGLVPAPTSGQQGYFLRGDGTWAVPTDTNITYTLTKSGNNIILTGSDGKTTSVIDDNTTYTLESFGINVSAEKINFLTDVTSNIQAQLNAKAASSHTHGNTDITSIDASKVNTGVLPISVIPKAALERLVPVSNDTARFALTTDDVQLGDTVKVESSGALYLVKDTNNLGNENGYEPYSTGLAAAVPWSGVTGKPTTLSGYGITDAAEKNHTHNYAGSSTPGGAATSAISDDKNQNIASTYVKSITANGTTITITYGNGTTKSINTQDTNTTYAVMSGASANSAGSQGLVPAPIAGQQGYFLRGDGTWGTPSDTNTKYKLTKSNGKIKLESLDGVDSYEVEDSNTTYTLESFGITVNADKINYLSGVTSDIQKQLDGKSSSGHTHNYAGSSTPGGAATSAISDDKNQTIASTYVKSITANGTTITITYGDDSTKTINTQDTNTTYAVMSGASANSAGSQGLVPAPAKNQQGLFLRGDGTWGTPSDTNTKYTLTKSNGKIILSSTDGVDSYEVEDSNTTYTLESFGVNVTASEINYLEGITSSVQSQLNSKAPSNHTHKYVSGISVSGTTVTITYGDGSSDTVTTQDTNTTYTLESFGIDVDSSKINFLTDVTSNIQAQLNAKASSTHTHKYVSGISVSGTTVTITYGDGSSDTVTTQDTNTTYTLESFGINVSAEKINFLTDVTSNIQAQLNAKAASSHTHTQSEIAKLGFDIASVVSSTQPSNPANGYVMWYNVLSTEA